MLLCLLFCDEFSLLPVHVYVETFPAIHMFSLSTGFMSFSVLSAVPYSCLLSRMCVAYAEMLLLLRIYRIWSLCLTDISLPVCPTYFNLQVLHVISYIPLNILINSVFNHIYADRCSHTLRNLVWILINFGSIHIFCRHMLQHTVWNFRSYL